MNPQQTHILGVKVDLLQSSEVQGTIASWLKQKSFHHLITLNPEIALLAEENPDYRKILNRADLTTVDGVGLQVGALLLGTNVPERCTGRQVIDFICKEAVRLDKSLFLLGGRGETSATASRRLEELYPGLRIAGAQEGVKSEEFDYRLPELIERINASKAEILLVAFGAPKQEIWIAENAKDLKHIQIAVGVGGLFDYLAGNVANPPKFVQTVGLEWLFRLITQPYRFKRIFRAVVVFPCRAFIWRIRMLLHYRENVLGVIQNQRGQLLLVSPAWSDVEKWQFPQGGIDGGESREAAILREMAEELGTSKFRIRQMKKDAYAYKWPRWYRVLRGYKGQRQSIFLLDFLGSDEEIDLEKENELSAWKWCAPGQLLSELSPPRRAIGQIALNAFRLIDERPEK